MNDRRESTRGVGERDVSGEWDSYEDVSHEFAQVERRKDRQLNLRVDQGLLAELRRIAAKKGMPYHTVARSYIEEGLARDLARQEDQVTTERPFSMKEAILVLLGAPGSTDHEEITGRTRLQKLLFLMAQHLQPRIATRFEAYNFGPFDEFVSQDVEFLREEGLVEGPQLSTSFGNAEERGQALLSWVQARTAEPGSEVDSYRLTAQGLEWVKRFLSSDRFGDPETKSSLWAESQELKRRFGRVPLEELVDYVYSEYPDFTAKSQIRDQVAARTARKSDGRR
jgi:hypothetical protein